ncbi:hypothetical protein YC2023_041659 [Brassica napus]
MTGPRLVLDGGMVLLTGYGAVEPRTGSGVLSIASVLSIPDGWLETNRLSLFTWVTWEWLAE